MRSASTTDLVVTSTSRSPRSSVRAAATIRSRSIRCAGRSVRCIVRSGFNETIGLLAQAESLLGEAEEVCALAANAALLASRLDHAAVDDPSPKVATVDREPEHRLVDVLELG